MAQTRTTGTILDRILARTALDVREREARTPLSALERLIETVAPPASMAAALARPGLSVIAEIKRASPSKGRFPVEIDPAILASDYLTGGADAISVLTDEPFFLGSLDDLDVVQDVTSSANPPVPVLRKDFMLGDYQIYESRAHGASAILLIVAALEQPALVNLQACARDLALDVLVEVHDEAEMQRAAEAGATLIGINNRDLRTFAVDLAVSERLAALAPDGAVLVGESGIFTQNDASRMQDCGMDAILVGESLVLADDRSVAIRALKGGESNATP